jgi:hypothetical protein
MLDRFASIVGELERWNPGRGVEAEDFMYLLTYLSSMVLLRTFLPAFFNLSYLFSSHVGIGRLF